MNIQTTKLNTRILIKQYAILSMMRSFDKALEIINEIESETLEQRILEKIQKNKKLIE